MHKHISLGRFSLGPTGKVGEMRLMMERMHFLCLGYQLEICDGMSVIRGATTW